MKQKKINDEVEKTLNVYEGIPELESNPFLYTRIRTAVNKKSGRKISVGTVLSPAFFLLLCIMNMYTFFSGNENDISKEDYLKAISSEYMLGSSSYSSYNFNE